MDSAAVMFLMCRDRIVVEPQAIYSESLELCSSNGVLLTVDCDGVTVASVVHE